MQSIALQIMLKKQILANNEIFPENNARFCLQRMGKYGTILGEKNRRKKL